jgi:hypothetical protein
VPGVFESNRPLQPAARTKSTLPSPSMSIGAIETLSSLVLFSMIVCGFQVGF